jgi:hypothetical protein
MRRCNCCQRLVEITERSRFRTQLYADEETGAVFMYLAMWECACQNTLSAVLWQDEECAAEEHAEFVHEQQGAADYERDEEPLNIAAHRGFFSLTHELASRGL